MRTGYWIWTNGNLEVTFRIPSRGTRFWLWLIYDAQWVRYSKGEPRG